MLRSNISLIGATNVGKSWFHFFLENNRAPTIEDHITPTLGSCHCSKSFTLRTPDHQTHSIDLQVWDSSGLYGQEERPYHTKANAVIFFYDITDQQSFDKIVDDLYPTITSECQSGTSFFLVGNKVDLESDREVDHNEVAKFISKTKTHGNYNTDSHPKPILQLFEISMKDSINCDHMLRTICKELLGYGDAVMNPSLGSPVQQHLDVDVEKSREALNTFIYNHPTHELKDKKSSRINKNKCMIM